MEETPLSVFVKTLPTSIQGSLAKFIKDSRYELKSIQNYLKELGGNYSVVEILEWLKSTIPISEKVKYLQSITKDAEGIAVKENLQYLFMRGIHLSIILLDKLELDPPEDPEKIGKLAKGILQETTRLGQVVKALQEEQDSKELVLGTTTEVIEILEKSFKDTQYEEFFRQSAQNALKLIESRQ